jgi:chromosome segregation ATPase
MAQVNEDKELIINLQDVDHKVEDLSKELICVFVEVDHELVDVLVYAVREHFAVIPYRAHRNIKLTLRNITRHANLGDAKLRMSLFDNFEGSLEQTLFLDNREKFSLHGQGEGDDVPSVQLVYEWRDPDEKPEEEHFDEVAYIIEQTRTSHLEMEDRMRAVENSFAHLARTAVEKQLIREVHVEDFKEVSVTQHEKSKKILEDINEFSRKQGDDTHQRTDDLNAQIRELEAQLRAIEDDIVKEQQTGKDLENDITSYAPVKVDPNAQRDADARHNKKEEVYRATVGIRDKTLSNVNKAKEDNLLWGLEQTQTKIKLFDDIETAQGKAKDSRIALEGVKGEIRKAQVDLAKKEFDLAMLENESQKLGELDRELGMRIREGEEALQAMLADRKDASDRGRELEDRANEYERLLAALEEEVNALKAESEGYTDAASQDLFKNSGKNNPEIQALSQDLDQAERDRDQAQNNLEAMEGAWVQSVEEVSTEAEKLAADSGDDKFKRDVQKLLKDILDASNRSADMYRTLEVTDQEINKLRAVDSSILAQDFAKDVQNRNTRLENEDQVVVDKINALQDKINQVEDEASKIPPLQEELDELLRQRDELLALYEELVQRKAQRDREDEERERQYQRDLAEYNRRVEEINREIKKLRSQIDDSKKQIINLQPQIEDLKEELQTWYDKIQIKREIIRKRKEEDELEDEYVPIPNDPIDLKIGAYKKNKVTAIPIKRIEEGQYMFATMRVEITSNGKYPSNYEVKVLRTGKRFDLDNFIRVEANKELDKLMKIQEDHEMVVDESEKTELRKSPGGGSNRGSPNRGSRATNVVTTEKITRYGK